MPRRRKRSGTATARSTSNRLRTRRRVVQKQPANAERRVYAKESVVRRSIRRSRETVGQSTSRIRARLRDARLVHGGDNLPQSKPRPARRLPQRPLSLAKTNAIAHREKMPPTACARRKQERRAVIIAKGFGGINRVKDYRRHRACR